MKRAYLKKADIGLILAVIVIAAGWFLFLQLRPAETGATVVITVADEPYASYPLSQNRRVDIVTEKGTNQVVIQDGTVQVETADCPQQICARHKAISQSGEVIVCLPHQVVITVVGGESAAVDTAI